MPKKDYLMEGDQEAVRLDMKTDSVVVKAQARWAGVESGMRIADLGCGSGKTSFILNHMAQPNGETIGVDMAEQRVLFAQSKYIAKGLQFIQMDIRDPLESLGHFDLVWIRFVLEYYRASSFDIVQNIAKIVKPGGRLCLIDLDHNCLNHFGLRPRIEKALVGIMGCLERHSDFDPFVGRKLYSYLYDLGFQEIDVNLTPHHLIFGDLSEANAFNWSKKVEIAAKYSGYAFEEYENGFDGFLAEFKTTFMDPRRFTYTPVITCQGRKLK